jgi:hypothetical protein
MTIFNWGESPFGKWTLIIESKSRNQEMPSTGNIQYFALRLFGTTKSPNKKHVPRYVDVSSPPSSLFPTYDELKGIYVEEKRLSRETSIIDRTLLETNPELSNFKN